MTALRAAGRISRARRLVTAGGSLRKGLVTSIQAMNRAIARYWQAAAAQT